MNEIEVEYFPIWRRYLPLIRNAGLSKLEMADLFMAMMEYQFEGKYPEELSDKLQVFWTFIRPDLDHARERYETAVRNGRKGGRKKQSKPEETTENQIEGISISESISESIPESISISESKEKPASKAEADLSSSQKAYGEYGWVKLSDAQYLQLRRTMGDTELAKCIAYIDESAQSTGNRNRWVDWYAVLKRCYQKRWHENQPRYSRKEEIPKGASGVLGPIELDAIQKLLAEG
jgi:hypothetical protein